MVKCLKTISILKSQRRRWLMMKNHKLAGAVGDVSFYEIKRQLSYKTARYGGSIIEVDRFFPSSKMCCKCGQIKKYLTLEDRTYVCDCGNVIDRDLNASINLEKYGMNWRIPLVWREL